MVEELKFYRYTRYNDKCDQPYEYTVYGSSLIDLDTNEERMLTMSEPSFERCWFETSKILDILDVEYGE